MKSTIIKSFAALTVAAFAVVTPALANPLSFTFNVDTESDLSVNKKPSMHKEGTILDVLKDDKRFTKVVKALEESHDLRDDLKRKDRITFLAPTDQAWKNIDMVLDSIRERRVDETDRRDRDEDRDRDRGHDHDRKDMEMVLKYHMLKDELTVKDLFNGQLLQTELKESKLGDKRQRIRVTDMFGQHYLNMYVRVHHDWLEAKNGKVLILDNVLCPPMEAKEMMAKIPFEYSTMLVAAEKTDMLKTMEDHKGITIFAPSNNAWKHLGIQNLVYLFSPHGCKDLKRIIQYHIARDVIYTTDMMKEDKMRVRTLLRDEELEICSCERKGHKGGRGGRRDRSREIDSKKGEEEPFDYVFTINKGEARIENICVDFFAENGVIQTINSVMIPSDVKLPFSMSNVEVDL